MIEWDIEDEVCEYAESLGILAIKLNLKGNVGWMDRMFIGFGQVWFIEFKAPGEVADPLQQYRQGEILSRGVGSFVCDNIEYGREIIDGYITT